ncbi:MAG: TIGR02281 family clan AA aspartic protease [Deferrisomatales bacterium]|nr:TIGR02281 family clan AA aspartic protease [Deferrisomatales bacterium]
MRATGPRPIGVFSLGVTRRAWATPSARLPVPAGRPADRCLARRGAAAAVALLLWAAAAAQAQIYRWTDEKGTVHFTDNLHSVPPDRRGQATALPEGEPHAAVPRAIPLEQADIGYVVEARLNGHALVRLVVDTGASSTVVSPEVAQRLGLTVRTEPPVLVRTAGGTVRAGLAQVAEIEVGGRRAGPLQVVVHDAVPGADGLLGMNFLALFRVELRADEPALLLSPR